MPLSADQLRELLTERSDPATYRPVPQEGLTMRIRRARIRQAAMAGLLTVAAVAGVVVAGPLGLDLTWRPAHVAAVSGKQFPASFTASDGAVYRRIAVTSMAAGQSSAALDVQVGSYPVDVLASCGAPGRDITATVQVSGKYANVLGCEGSPQLTGLYVRPGRRADITFVNQALVSGHLSASWQFAAYTWQPPAIARPAPAVPRLPASYAGLKSGDVGTTGTTRLSLLGSRSGDWPADRTVTITVPDHGRYYDVVLACSGAIGNRLQVSMLIEATRPIRCPAVHGRRDSSRLPVRAAAAGRACRTPSRSASRPPVPSGPPLTPNAR